MDAWRELEKIRNDIRALSERVSQQAAKVDRAPEIRLCHSASITSVSGLPTLSATERTVDSSGTDPIEEIYEVAGRASAGESILVGLDSDGNRYAVQPDKPIPLQGAGSDTAQIIDISSAGARTVPPGQSAKPFARAESISQFKTDDTVLTGRVYMGQEKTGYHLVFLAGQGPGLGTPEFSETTSKGASSGWHEATVTVGVDGQGNVVSFAATGIGTGTGVPPTCDGVVFDAECCSSTVSVTGCGADSEPVTLDLFTTFYRNAHCSWEQTIVSFPIQHDYDLFFDTSLGTPAWVLILDEFNNSTSTHVARNIFIGDTVDPNGTYTRDAGDPRDFGPSLCSDDDFVASGGRDDNPF